LPDPLSPAALGWIHRAAVLVHIAGVVVWMGAVADARLALIFSRADSLPDHRPVTTVTLTAHRPR